MAIAFDWMGAMDGQNNRLQQQRAIGERYAMDRGNLGLQAERSGLEDAAQARMLRGRQFDEQGRQFDSRMNILRDLFNRPQPQFFGGGMGQGQPMQQGGGFASSMGNGGMGMNKPMRTDGISGPLENYLLRYLRG